MKYVPPSVKETAFNCPHCGALTTQYWYDLHADIRDRNHPLPVIFDEIGALESEFDDIQDEKTRTMMMDWAKRMATGLPFMENSSNGSYINNHLYNVQLSSCYNCKALAVWIHDRLIHPQRGEAPAANTDMPADIRRDYDEASTILNHSPRGAAALIRLGIQKLCKELGQSGKNINDDIGALVKTGLDLRIQQALDVVRVVGNNAVHPGQIDLRDDRATAETLFKLLNLIVDRTISEPKHVKQMYDALPDSQLKAIEKRDGKPGT